MRERPILFSGPMVRAILDGSKTQTRRIVRPDEVVIGPSLGMHLGTGQSAWYIGRNRWSVSGTLPPPEYVRRCPYGEPGDRLWVRETWDFRPWEDERGDGRVRIAFGADGSQVERVAPADWNPTLRGGWRPSIFMPRWASRITLEITSVRVERLQSITEEDARAEGVGSISIVGESGSTPMAGWAAAGHVTAREHFAALWDEINGARAPWASNPWLWVLGFKRVEESDPRAMHPYKIWLDEIARQRGTGKYRRRPGAFEVAERMRARIAEIEAGNRAAEGEETERP